MLLNGDWVTQISIDSLKESSLLNYVDIIARAITPDLVVQKFIIKDESGEIINFSHHVGCEYDMYEQAETAIHTLLLRHPLKFYSIHKIFKVNQ